MQASEPTSRVSKKCRNAQAIAGTKYFLGENAPNAYLGNWSFI